jgi:hypothetical protein
MFFRFLSRILDFREIPILKNQITNNIQKPMNQSTKRWRLSQIWNLIIGIYLLFGISFQNP